MSSRGTLSGDGLEIGSGAGRYSLHLIQRGLFFDVSDISAEQLQVQIADAEALSISRGPDSQVIVGTIENIIDRGEARYDFIFGFNVLHHINNLDQNVFLLRRLLKPGGVAVFHEPNPFNPMHYIQSILDLRRKMKDELGMLNTTASQLRSIFNRAGFENFQYRKYGYFPPFVPNTQIGLHLEAWLNRFRFIGLPTTYQLIKAQKKG